MSQRLRIALTKGRLQEKSVELFEAMGLDCSPIQSPGRRLVHAIPNYPLDAVLAKAPDVITYVEHGVCDLGIVGKDTILEQGRSFYEVLDLQFGKCRFALAVKEGSDFYGTYKTRRIATKYPNVARTFFEKKGMDVDIIKIEGSLDLLDLDALGYIDHKITVNIIKDGVISEKKILRLPKRITNVIHCKNPRCITSIEQELPHVFDLTDEENKVYRCIYCETKHR